MRKFGMFFRAIHRESDGSQESGQAPIFPQWDTRAKACNRSIRRQTVSNLSMTIVSARPSRVHSWNAGSDCIAS
jgi:hypothetical protein